MTLREITASLISSIRGGKQTDDEEIHPRQLELYVNNYRNILLNKHFASIPSYSFSDNEVLIQDLGCVEIELVDKAECQDIITDCYLFRTKKKMPKPVTIKNQLGISYVGSITRDHDFQMVPNQRIRWMQYNPITGKSKYSFYRNNYIYIVNADCEVINIRGIFESPRDVEGFEQIDGTSCFNQDSQYPVLDSMIPVIMDMIMKNELRSYLLTPSDTINDSSGKIVQRVPTNEKQQ